jgi:DNA topoisomerase-1
VESTWRILFHEITEQAIRNAVRHPIRLNMNVVHAQQARQILDMLVGYKITPVLWNSISNTKLSAGRCQTPALRLVYDNEMEIRANPGKQVYKSVGYFTNKNIAFELDKQWETELDVQRFLEECKHHAFQYTISDAKVSIREPPKPLTTSTLQQLASNELNMSPKDTMKYAQQLYEEGYITYMRTDNTHFSHEFVQSVDTYICSKYAQHANSNAEAVAEPGAHEAIRPVQISCQTPNITESKVLRLYELIWRRSVESCMMPAKYHVITASITAPMNATFIYQAENVISLGWRAVKSNENNDNDNDFYYYLQSMMQGISLFPKVIDCQFTLMEKKSRLTEARLVQLLEERGIGRPSTFASLVDKIQERNYVSKQDVEGILVTSNDYKLTSHSNEININIIETQRHFGKEKKKLIIQPLGIAVIEFLFQMFSPFFQYDYTNEMEIKLDAIAAGEIPWNPLCQKCYEELTSALELSHVPKWNIPIDSQHSIIMGKYGPVVKCINANKKASFLPLKKDLDLNALQSQSNQIILADILAEPHVESIGKYHGKDLFIRNGKFGMYAQWGNERKSLKDFQANATYPNIIRFLDEDIIDPKKPIGFIRELSPTMSIRSGKYGDYIYYKKPRMKKPMFYKLDGFKDNYRICNKELLLNWIQLTYKCE